MLIRSILDVPHLRLSIEHGVVYRERRVLSHAAQAFHPITS
jgi:hypothetical protein